MPNQHGAWAMLASPYLVGAIAAGFAWVQLPLAGLWVTGYLAFYAAGLWLKSGRRARYLPPVRAYVVVSAAFGLAVLALQPGLVVWLPVFVPILAIGLWAAARRQERELVVGLTTMLAAGLMTVVVYDTATSGSLRVGWVLGAVQLLYFAGTVFYVKSVIRERGNRSFLLVSVGYHLAATVAVAFVSWLLAAVFAALTVRAAVVPRLRPTPKQVGIGEVVATVVVAVCSLVSVR